jgi:hypothetical protein
VGGGILCIESCCVGVDSCCKSRPCRSAALAGGLQRVPSQRLALGASVCLTSTYKPLTALPVMLTLYQPPSLHITHFSGQGPCFIPHCTSEEHRCCSETSSSLSPTRRYDADDTAPCRRFSLLRDTRMRRSCRLQII